MSVILNSDQPLSKSGMLTQSMSCSSVQPPTTESLTRGLTVMLCDSLQKDGEVAILDREPNVYASTFPSETVTCDFSDKRGIQLFCKYGTSYVSVISGHRRGVPYEVEIYSKVLSMRKGSTSSFYGSYTDETTGITWLVTEYCQKSVRLDLIPQADAPQSMEAAARWLGKFHAENEVVASNSPTSFLNIYDVDHLLLWKSKLMLIQEHFKQTFPWLTDLFEHFVAFLISFMPSTPTVVHGEFYPSNILNHDGQVKVVDWESAGTGTGEMDLVALTQAWPEHIVHRCESVYQEARWPHDQPAHFDKILIAARLYFHFKQLFYWIEFQPDRPIRETWLFQELHVAGQRLGLLS